MAMGSLPSIGVDSKIPPTPFAKGGPGASSPLEKGAGGISFHTGWRNAPEPFMANPPASSGHFPRRVAGFVAHGERPSSKTRDKDDYHAGKGAERAVLEEGLFEAGRELA